MHTVHNKNQYSKNTQYTPLRQADLLHKSCPRPIFLRGLQTSHDRTQKQSTCVAIRATDETEKTEKI